MSDPVDDVRVHSDRLAVRIRVGIVDDHRLMLDGLTTWLGAEAADLDVAIAVTGFRELLRHPAFPVDVVLLDLDLGDDVPTSAKIVELAAAGIAVVVVSSFADPRRVRESIAAGALGYVPKSENMAEIVQAVQAAAHGETHLTPALAAMLVAGEGRGENAPSLSPQERRALVLYASGLPLKSVARQLDISVETAKTYLTRVREKYAHAGREARTKIALHRRAVEDGLLHDNHDHDNHDHRKGRGAADHDSRDGADGPDGLAELNILDGSDGPAAAAAGQAVERASNGQGDGVRIELPAQVQPQSERAPL